MATTIGADILWEGEDGSTTVTEGLEVPLTWFKPGELPPEVLHRGLEAKVAAEDYEGAAEIRDFINKNKDGSQ
jgi:hypothetical protein